jgi:CBS domain-containing protein
VAGGTIRVGEVMQTSIVSCRPDATVADACALMRKRSVGACLVIDGERLAGIFTERDLLRLVAESQDPRDWPLTRVMTTNPTVCPPDTDVLWAGETMRRMAVRHLPVVEGDVVVGMVSLRDLFVVAEAVLRLDPRGAETAREMLAAAKP